jgi:hypothetical protein
LTRLGCNDDFGGTLQSQTSGAVTAGQTYYVQLGGWNGATGSYILKLSIQ